MTGHLAVSLNPIPPSVRLQSRERIDSTAAGRWNDAFPAGDSMMSLRYRFSHLLLCFFTLLAILALGSLAHAVPVQTTYSYVGADYNYQPGSSFTYNGDPYPLPGTDYAAILGPRLTAVVTLDGDTSNATGVYETGYLGNPVGYRGVLEFSFSSGSVLFSSEYYNFNVSLTLLNGTVTNWSFSSNFPALSSCGVGPFCAGGYLQTLTYPVNHDYIRFLIPYPGANYGAESGGRGTWTIDSVTPVPGPVVGAGIPGILMAIAGFIGWRRRRWPVR